jgi:chromosome segregation ATPase
MSGCHNPDYSPVPQKTDMQIVAERLDEMHNAMAELSMKINKMQSSLHEFEKQKIDPKFDVLTKFVDNTEKNFKLVEKITSHLTQQLDDHEERINELEEGDDY